MRPTAPYTNFTEININAQYLEVPYRTGHWNPGKRGHFPWVDQLLEMPELTFRSAVRPMLCLPRCVDSMVTLCDQTNKDVQIIRKAHAPSDSMVPS